MMDSEIKYSIESASPLAVKAMEEATAKADLPATLDKKSVEWRPMGLDSEGSLWVQAFDAMRGLGIADQQAFRKVEGLPRETFDTLMPERALEMINESISIVDAGFDMLFAFTWGLTPEVEAFRKKLREVIME